MELDSAKILPITPNLPCLEAISITPDLNLSDDGLCFRACNHLAEAATTSWKMSQSGRRMRFIVGLAGWFVRQHGVSRRNLP